MFFFLFGPQLDWLFESFFKVYMLQNETKNKKQRIKKKHIATSTHEQKKHALFEFVNQDHTSLEKQAC